jgi:hypothetical protein
MASDDKQVITYYELMSKVEALLVAHPECRKVRIKKIQLLKEKIGTANWHLITDGDVRYLNKCEARILEYIRNLRKAYDVDPASVPASQVST